MATITLTATVELGSTPPRVKLSVSATGTPTVTSVTIHRQDPDGRERLVRTADDGPLPLSGGVATLWDNEPWYGVPLTYVVDQENKPTATVTVAVDRLWLVHPGVPSRSVPLSLRVGSNQSEDWDIEQGVFPILERTTPVVVTSGARLEPASSLIVETTTFTELSALKLLLSDGSALLLNVPPSIGLGLATAYVAVGKARNSRQSTVGMDPTRDIELPYQVVDRPAGGTQAAITWNDVATVGVNAYTAAAGSQYLTWASIPADGVASWAALAAPTS